MDSSTLWAVIYFNMGLTKLLDWGYLIERYPAAGFSWTLRIILLIIFIGGIVMALYAYTKLKDKTPPKNLWIRLQTWGWSVGVVGLLLMIFRETRAIYLSARLYLLLWLVVTFVWLIYIIYYAKVILPRQKRHEEIDDEIKNIYPKKEIIIHLFDKKRL